MAEETKEVLVKITLDDKQYQDEIAKQTEANIKNTGSQDENTEAKKEGEDVTEDYSAATGALTGQIDKMTGGMASATKGIFAQIKSFKSLKVAIAASGIGLIVLAFAAIWTAVNRLEGPMQKFAELMKGIEGVTGVLLDTFGKLGVALVQLFSGNGEKAVETYRKAMEGVGDEVVRMFNLGVLIAKQQKENSVNESARNAVIAKNNRAIERELLISRDIGKSIEVRQAAIARANELQLKNVNSAGKSSRERLQIAKNEFELSSKNSKDVIAFNEALTEFQNSQLQREIRLRDLENRRVDLQRQSEALSKKERDEALKAAGARGDEWVLEQKRLEETNKFIDDIQAKIDSDENIDGLLYKLLYGDAETREKERERQQETTDWVDSFFENQNLQEEKADEVAKTEHEKALARARKREQQEKNTANVTGEFWLQTYNMIGDGVQELFGKNKELSIATTIINGISAIIKTFDFYGFTPPGFAAAIAMATTTAGAVAKISSQEMALGGWLQGPSHSGGGIDINAEGGEFMVNKRSMANPVLSSIVENINDFGNRQVMALGGFVGSQASQLSAIRALPQSIGNVVNDFQPVLVTEDLDVVQGRVAVTEDRSTLSG